MKTMMCSRFIITGMNNMIDEEKDIPVDEKPGMIKNPLKIPPANKKSELEYDIEVADDDDYDIK